MKLYCLSGDGSLPCFVLKFKATTVMLDCALDMSTMARFLPKTVVHSTRLAQLPGWSPKDSPGLGKLEQELKECAGRIFIDSEPEFAIPQLDILDLSEVDVILVSNYHCIMALPYITEYSSFKGVVYATEPTLHYGRQLMEELVAHIERSPKLNAATKWKQPNALGQLPAYMRDHVPLSWWRMCYNRHDVNSAVAKITPVGFSEKLEVFGSVRVTAISSGYCLGSCNWIMQSEYEKIAYLSGSSTLTTHPKPMEQSLLKYSDIMLMSCLTQTPTFNPDAMIGEFCLNAGMTLKNGGNVLVPCYPSGVTYDLFECLSGHLDNLSLSQVPMYFLSPVADSSLAYSNIYSEWLSSSKASKVYLPEQPFPHGELVKTGRLKQFPSIHEGLSADMKCPCVVFVGHPSLRCGDVVHFLELWGRSNANTIIFTEPEFPYIEALAPYQPLAMKVCYCPIDTRLSFTQANKLVRDLKPVHLVVSEQYLTPPITMPDRSDLIIECEPSPVTYRRGEVLSLPVKRNYEKVEMTPQLAAGLMPTEIQPGIAVTTITGELVAKDNKYLLQEVDKSLSKKNPLKRFHPPTHVWGNLDVHQFVDHLKLEGIMDAKVEESAEGYIVHLASEDSLIQIESDSTHVICEGNEALRVKIKDVLLQCLAKL